MCCLFGMMDYRGTLSVKEKARVLHALATAAEARGTDATGIAYLSGGRMHVYKRPLPGHRLQFRIPRDTKVVMGHTRLGTRGNAKRNYNNHPFQARAGGRPFALAHNGVLYNDISLRQQLALPHTKIQTDTYVAVQMLKRAGTISSRTLQTMAEQLDGSFTFTVLDYRESLYFVRGNNPLHLYHCSDMGLYLYASTQEILDKAIQSIPVPLGESESVPLTSGEILKVNIRGIQSRSQFDDSRLWYNGYLPYSSASWWSSGGAPVHPDAKSQTQHAQALRSVAGAFGLTPQEIDQLLQEGFTEQEIEDYLYCGEL